MRTKQAKNKIISADPLYKSRVVARLINKVMKGGKKSLAEGIVYTVLDNLSKDRKEALISLEQAVKNVMPKQEVRSRRVGGATYQIPFPLKHDRSEALAIRWLVDVAKSRKGKPMNEKLLEEVKSASGGTGGAIKKRDDTHKMAEANRAFSHFRF